MNKQEYLIELRQRLNPLPLSIDEITDAVQYYEEYFSEAGPEREQEVIKELGSPAYVAAQIALKLTGSLEPARESAAREGTAREKISKPVKRNSSLAKMVLLGVLAAPVALPLMIAAVAVIGALFITIGALVVSFFIPGLVIAVASVPTLVFGVITMVTDFSTGIYWIGCALFMLGVGGFMTKLGMVVGRLGVKAITFIGGKVIRRGDAARPDIEHKVEDLRVSPETEGYKDAQAN
ncbi:MAG: DUF1700 domain-containing protein [Clostridiales bacterium]|jgi:uncharacterized membrane protein|nr:DUF1700 domain-containing protein [Clostridiales bacterium]